MLIKNARVFTEDGSFMQGDVVVKDGRFDSVLERTADTDAAADSTQQEIIDASRSYHDTGSCGYSFSWMQGS